MVFNIQRYSINDGPGIRTTVFLKGCPLHCLWCHNPESISTDQEIVLREDRCIRCGSCIECCSQHAIRNESNLIVTSCEKCIRCGNCVEVCYAGGREIAGKEMSVEDVVKEIEKDIIFYNRSTGGVTFSGGEPFLQHLFLKSLLENCKSKNIHTAVDTAGFVVENILNGFENLIDLFLYDIKTVDDFKHRMFTGGSNKIILDNLRFLINQGNNIIIRVPVIPGFNNNLHDMKLVGEFVDSLKNISEIHLLPYHKSGTEKYKRLGIKFEMNDEPPDSTAMELIAAEMKKYVQTVKIGG